MAVSSVYGPWRYDGSKIYSGAAPTGWTDLDLRLTSTGSATTHPTRRSMALLKVTCSSGSAAIAFRSNGESRDTYTTSYFDHGCTSIDVQSASSEACLVFLPTDGYGVVEWKAESGVTTDIWLMGFVAGSVPYKIIRADSALPTTWTMLAMSQDIYAASTGLNGEGVAYLWIDRSGGTTNEVAMRPATPGSSNYNTPNALGGCSQCRPPNIGSSEGIVIKTDSTAVADLIAESVPPNAEITLAMFEDDYFSNFNTTVYAAAPPPTSWTELDLSAQILKRKALVMLDVHLENASPGPIQSVAVRMKGDTGEYIAGDAQLPAGVARCAMYEDDRAILLCGTDELGCIEWRASSTDRDVDIKLIGAVCEIGEVSAGAYGPIGVCLGDTLPTISAQITGTLGLDISTLVIRAVPALGVATTIYTGSAWQTGWGGVIAESDLAGTDPKRVDVSIDTFPASFRESSPSRWTIEIDVDDISGESL